jgi:trk system potassium uptake protein TrkH
MHGLQEFNFDELKHFTKYLLIVFMIIGRVELLTILIITKKFLFKN